MRSSGQIPDAWRAWVRIGERAGSWASLVDPALTLWKAISFGVHTPSAAMSLAIAPLAVPLKLGLTGPTLPAADHALIISP